jgi:hypothetical protein
MLTKDGKVRECETSSTMILYNGIWASFFTSHDITDSKRMQMVIKESEEKYRLLFEAESDAIFMIDAHTGQILDTNPAASRIYGFSKDELSVKVTEDSSGRKLVVSGKKNTDDSKSAFYRVKGLSNHSFKRVFNLASSTVHAISYVDGILKIEVLFQNEQQETSFKIN